ncbi:hypothetical protein ACH4OX_09995 [Streptomyces roseolus]|uniref:hypothetical protein n=1 Tax=Streptomyces roseolus TaxID=67358 RepID=UPI0037878376
MGASGTAFSRSAPERIGLPYGPYEKTGLPYGPYKKTGLPHGPYEKAVREG